MELTFPAAETASISARVRGNASSGHLAPIFGVLLRVLDVDLTDTQRAFLYITSRAVSSSAVRLGLIGAYEGQAIQAALAPAMDKVMREHGGLDHRDIAPTAPLIGLLPSPPT